MTTEPLTTLRPRAGRRTAPTPIAVALGVFGAVAIAKGTWGLAAPDSLIGAGEALVNTPILRFTATALIWTTFLALATYFTVKGRTLRRWETVAAWALLVWLWAIGMLLVYVPPAGQAALVALAREHAATLRGVSLLTLVMGAVLLAAELALWLDRPGAGRRPRRRPPRLIHDRHAT
jgi:hypothetical protein